MRGLVRQGAVIAGLLYSCATPYGAPNETATDAGPPGVLAGDVEISPTSLDFGPVQCGQESAPQVIVLRNLTDEPLSYEARLPAGSAFVIKNLAAGTIDPRGSVGIPVAASPNAAGDLVAGVFVTAGRSFAEVSARSKGAGAVLEIAPGLVDFGEVRRGLRSAPISVDLTNTGTEPVIVTAFEGATAGLGVTLDEPLTVPPGASRPVSAHFDAPAQTGAVEAVLTPAMTGPQCATRPTMTLRGTSVDVAVTLSTGNFGVHACNASPANQDVTITNYSTAPLTIESATLPASSRFEVVTTLPVSVPPASGATPGTATITVRAAPGAELGVFEESLTVDVSGLPAPDGGARTTKLRIDVQGAILSITPSVLNFESRIPKVDTKQFTIENKGNAAITVEYDFARTAGLAAWYCESGPESIGPGQSQQIDLGFRPQQIRPGTYEGRLTTRRVSGAAACTPMPSATARGVSR